MIIHFILQFLTIISNASAEQYIVTSKGVEITGMTISSFSPISDIFGMHLVDRESLIQNWRIISDMYEIEPDNPVTIKVQKSEPWHRQRIVKDTPVYNADPYPYREPGSCYMTASNVTIDTYIVDTGIDVTHPQFGGRATWLANFADKTQLDCQGHGTHVAGLVGSRDYGVCVDARLFAVKVLDCNGSGRLSGVIKGIDFVYRRHIKKKKTKSIINMSLGGGKSRALDNVVNRVVTGSSDFFVVVAAGNENEDACQGSPSGAQHAFTVMASDRSDKRAYFSNWGECCDIYSPGVDILSTIPGGTDVYSGTSMASPIVAGVVGMFISRYPNLENYKLLETMYKQGTQNVIKGLYPGALIRLPSSPKP
ncbi:S8 family peptidase [bacterium]|nr:S8 family peptidase [bacterium]NDC94453.1 S8 family peptidase [bacterium]NDD84026.1 S8 family peptidase [bacterium]NDG29882.1 S8 family peptidase [bacterium]